MLPSFLLNNSVNASVKNRQELELDLSFTEYNPTPSPLSPEFVNSDGVTIEFLKEWINLYGFSTKIPTVASFGNIDISGYLDCANSSNVFIENPQETIYKLQFISNSQNFNELASNLRLDKFISKDDYVLYRYVINNIPDYIEVILLAISLYLIVKEGIQIIQNLFKIVKASFSSGFDSITALLKVLFTIVMNLIYLIAILIAVNELLKLISENLFAKPRKYYALDVLDTLQKGCEYLGFTFESDVLENELKGLTYAKSTAYNTDSKGNVIRQSELTKAPINDPIPEYDFITFIENISQLRNLKLRITKDNVVKLETREIYESNALDIKLSDLYNKGEFSFEGETQLKYIYVGYNVDSSDKNSMINEAAYTYDFDISTVERNDDTTLSTELSNAVQELQGNNDAINVSLPYEFPSRKEDQSKIEKFFNSLFDIIAGLDSNYKVKNGDRVGYMQLATDILTTDTIFIRDNEKISTTSFDLLKAQTIIESYASEGMDQSQWRTIKSRGKDPLTTQEGFEGIIENNVIHDDQGDVIIIQNNSYNSHSGLFELDYKKRLKSGDLGYIKPNQISIQKISINKTGISNGG